MERPPAVLVIRRRYLGDIVLLGPLLRSLKAHWPAARVSVLVEAAYADVLALNPDVDAVLTLPRSAWAWPTFLGKARAARFTHVLDLDNTERTALVARASGAPVRVALHHGAHPVRLRRLYTQVVHEPADVHESRPITEYYLASLGPLGVPASSRAVRLVPKESDVAEWRRYVGSQGRMLLVHPGSRSPARLWPSERFAQVCDRVQDELGVQVVLVGGPSERRQIAAIRAAARMHIMGLDEAPSIGRFAALARASSALLCHDSGPMHVAAAVGTPVVALYGSQNPRLFRPQGEGHVCILPRLPCEPCLSPGICVPGDSYRSHCVRHHTVDQVFEAVRTVLSRTVPPSS